MALINNDLYSQTERQGLPAIQPAAGPGALITRTFDAVSGGGTLVPGTPVYVAAATGLLMKCVPTAASGESLVIFGFVFPRDVILDDSNDGDGDAVGTVMVRGSIDFNHLAALQAGTVTGTSEIAGNLQELEDMCRKIAVHNAGLHIDNLPKIGGNDGL